MDNTLAITLAVAASGIVGKLIAVWERRQQNARIDRNRELDRQDRINQAADTARALKLEADRVTHASQAQTGEVLDKIQAVSEGLEQNTQVNVRAIDAGNNFNVKLEKVHARIDTVVNDLNGTIGPMKVAIAKIQQQLS